MYDAVRNAILGGELRNGARLPSTRAFARELGVSRTVVLTAFDQLAAEGFLEGRTGSGTFVSAALVPGADQPGSSPGVLPARERWSEMGSRVIAAAGHPASEDTVEWDLTPGALRPDEFPDRRWARRLASRLGRSGYGPAAGSPRLRRAVARYLASARGVRASWKDVVIVQGARQGLDLLGRLLIDPGDAVVLEEPHYPDARRTFAAWGARFATAPVDGRGLDVGALPEDASARIAYVTPSHQYPTGAVMAIERRQALLDWAGRADALIVEDDYDSEFRYEGRPVPALQGLDVAGRVIYLGTFSKVLSPDLRLGYIVAPPWLAPAITAAKRLSDRQSPLFLQEAVAAYMEAGHFSRHLWRMRRRYARRREAMVRALETGLGGTAEILSGAAGIQLLLRFPGLPPEDAETLRDRFLAEGVRMETADECYLNGASCAEFVVGFAGYDPERLVEAGATVSTTARRYMAGRRTDSGAAS